MVWFGLVGFGFVEGVGYCSSSSSRAVISSISVGVS